LPSSSVHKRGFASARPMSITWLTVT
jgi:hypothetical protein